MSAVPPPPGPARDSGLLEVGRRESLAGRFARLGLAQPSVAASLLSDPAVVAGLGAAGLLTPGGLLTPELEVDLAAAADPDYAFDVLVRLLRGRATDTLLADSALRRQLLLVAGVSSVLGDFVVRHPSALEVLAPREYETAPDIRDVRAEVLSAIGADPGASAPVATRSGPAGADALRVAYRRRLLALAARDLGAPSGAALSEHVGAELADLADATLAAALALARAELPAGAAPCRLAIVAMGKCGGRELNYISDVDVIFVAEPVGDAQAEPALRTATLLAAAVMRICSATTTEGSIWEVDAGLRPEGKAGPLVRTLASHLAYYERWARTWEFQALLKARPAAGDRALGEEYVAALAPKVWAAAERENFVAEVQGMRRRVEKHLPPGEAERQLKLGPGGLRDVEFAVQLLQLVHGRTDPALRLRGTLESLQALSDGGYVAREDAAALRDAYRFLRTLEHRMQLHQLRRISVVPDAEVDLRRLGRAMGYAVDPVRELGAARKKAAVEVRRLHEKLFYRPLLTAVARLDSTEARLPPDAAVARLEALGYADPQGALRHLQSLTTGMTRTAAIQRTLLPVMLGWFADAPDPDAGLLAFRRVSEAMGTTSWYLRVLRDEGALAERMARVLASGRYASDLLLRAPQALALLSDDNDLRPQPHASLLEEIVAAVRRQPDADVAARAARAIRRRELFRTSAADVLYAQTESEVGESLTTIAAATLAGALDAAERTVLAGGPSPVRLAVIGVGRLGGGEMSYASDADVLFVCEPVAGAAEEVALRTAHDIANELRRTLASPAPDPPLLVDPDLRPEGRQGPLIRTLGSYAAYYARWAQVWERQALLRARPVAGDIELADRFVRLINPLRYPVDGLDAEQVREIRRIKARVEAERLPRGADPTTHLKLGRGGLADVEWTVQLLQLRHAGRLAELQTTRTLAALTAARDAGLIEAADATVLEEAWRLACRLRNGLMLLTGRASDTLPSNVNELAALARLLGHPDHAGTTLLEDWLRVSRRARAVVERTFYE